MSEQSIAALFEHLVELNPQQEAVNHCGESLTFEALNRASNRVARAIVGQRGEREEAVALLYGKTTAVISALLGTLKAGKFYVALDASDPPGRSTLILQDAQAGLLLCDREHLVQAQTIAPPGCVVINVGSMARELDDDNLGLDIAGDRLVSLTYTSGSTGTPKGTARTQQSVMIMVQGRGERGLNRPGDRQAMLYSLSVASMETIVFSALLNDCSCCVYDIQKEGFGGIAAWMQREKVSLYQSTPTVFRHFIAQLREPVDLPALRLVSLNGEPALKHDFELFKKHFNPPCLLRVAYGSTEAHGVTEYLLDHTTVVNSSIVPVGHPLPGVEVLIWDEQGRELGCGQAGEIVVRSPRLSSGYWRRPELTASTFIPDPAVEGGRLYRTKDLGMLRPDGMLEQFGRIDQQIKVRGRRVETGEVEAALLAQDFVQQAIVVAHDDEQGENKLIAYLVATKNAMPSAAALRERLSMLLSEYMLPAGFVRMDAFPPSASGKVDRRALPVFEAPAASPSSTVPGAMDEVEAKLTDIWQDLLHAGPVGREDNFFDMGGHSLLAAELCSRIEQVWKQKLAPADVALASTVRQLAMLLREGRRRPGSQLVVPLQPGQARRPFLCVHGFGGGVLGYIPLARRLGPAQPFYALQARGIDDGCEPHKSIPDMAAAYVAAVREVQPRGPYHLGGYCYGGVVAYEMACPLTAQGERVALVAIFEGYAPTRARTSGSPWNPRHVISFSQNIPYWFRDYTRLGLQGMAARAARKGRRALRRLSSATNDPTQLSLDDSVDGLSRVSTTTYNLLRAHLGALRRYWPQAYSGEVTLFRVRGLSLFRAHDPSMGGPAWRPVAWTSRWSAALTTTFSTSRTCRPSRPPWRLACVMSCEGKRQATCTRFEVEGRAASSSTGEWPR